MSQNSFFLTGALIPMICIGSVSCTALKNGQASFREWQEKRDQRQAERQLAKAEKEAGLTEDPRLVDAQAAPVFLDYDNPNAMTAAGTRAEGNRDAGFSVTGDAPVGELPGSVGELTNTLTTSGEPASTPVFLPDDASGAHVRPALHPDIVRAWAGSIAQVTGTSLAEPLITAAMTATAESRVSAAGADPAERTSMRRSTAAAFAGQESVGLKTSEHEADWSSRQ